MNTFERVELPVYENLLDELNKLIVWDNHMQICLNAPPGHTDDHQFGNGSLIKDWENSYTQWNDDLGTDEWIVPNREVPLKEEDFTEVCDIFKGTVFEEIVNMIDDNYNTGRIRIMKLKPKSCLTWHRDDTIRLHYPFLTHDGSMMVINDEVQHLGENEWWLANTIEPHTAINANVKPRLHIVTCIL